MRVNTYNYIKTVPLRLAVVATNMCISILATSFLSTTTHAHHPDRKEIIKMRETHRTACEYGVRVLVLFFIYSTSALWLPIPLKVFVVLYLARRMLKTRVSDTIPFRFSGNAMHIIHIYLTAADAAADDQNEKKIIIHFSLKNIFRFQWAGAASNENFIFRHQI